MKYNFKVLSAAIVLKSMTALAGGWTSGGGELIRDQHNPWFISNTTQVNYCIQIDEAEFGRSKQFVRTQITKSLDFWKKQLQDLNYSTIAQSQFKFILGTQNFTEVSCDLNPDITFQFGVLDHEQKKRLGDISKVIGLSVRTDYDLKNLKAKGFLYFAKDNQFAIHPWSSDAGVRLLPVLVHELGHIFGVEHTNDVEFMAEDYPESLIEEGSKSWVLSWANFLNNGGLEKVSLFKYKPMHQIMSLCKSESITIPINPNPIVTDKVKYMFSQGPVSRISQSIYDRFFNRKESDTCQNEIINGDQFEFYSGKDKTDLIGKANLTTQTENDLFSLMTNRTDIIHFWIPKEQTVFTGLNQDQLNQKYSVASFQPKVFFKGDYKTVDGKFSRQLVLEVSNSGSIERMSGMLDGILYNDLRSGF